MFARNLFYSGTGVKISQRERERDANHKALSWHNDMEFLYPDKARGEFQRSSVSKITNETRPTRKCMGKSNIYIYIYI